MLVEESKTMTTSLIQHSTHREEDTLHHLIKLHPSELKLGGVKSASDDVIIKELHRPMELLADERCCDHLPQLSYSSASEEPLNICCRPLDSELHVELVTAQHLGHTSDSRTRC